MVFILPSGILVRAFINFTMGIWALIHVATMCDAQLQSNPSTIGLTVFKPMIECIMLSKVEIHQLKCKLEIFLLLISVPAVFYTQVALIFPILYIQYIRIKYVGSYALRKSFDDLGAIFVTYVPGLYNLSIVQTLRSYCKSFVKFKDESETKVKKDPSFRDKKVDETQETQGIQGGQGSGAHKRN